MDLVADSYARSGGIAGGVGLVGQVGGKPSVWITEINLWWCDIHILTLIFFFFFFGTSWEKICGWAPARLSSLSLASRSIRTQEHIHKGQDPNRALPKLTPAHALYPPTPHLCHSGLSHCLCSACDRLSSYNPPWSIDYWRGAFETVAEPSVWMGPTS